jgi:hypothetical protein
VSEGISSDDESILKSVMRNGSDLKVGRVKEKDRQTEEGMEILLWTVVHEQVPLVNPQFLRYLPPPLSLKLLQFPTTAFSCKDPASKLMDVAGPYMRRFGRA